MTNIRPLAKLNKAVKIADACDQGKTKSKSFLVVHPTKYGVQFTAWERAQNRTALYQGNYCGPNMGIDSYIAAKWNFATRSGWVPKSIFFTPEQLTGIYRSIHETLESAHPITDERQKCIEQATSQIECTVLGLKYELPFPTRRSWSPIRE